jgi:Predicted phosphohydrolases
LIVLICLAALAVFFLLVMAVDCNRFVVRTYRCRMKNLKKDGRAVLLSDLHGKSFGKENKKLLAAIDRLNPDMIWIAGDMYTCEKGADPDAAASFTEKLAEKYPVYYGNGNHEQKTGIYPEDYGNLYRDYFDRMKKAGVRHLVNEKVYLPEFNMDIYGMEIDLDYYKKFQSISMEGDYPDRLLGKPDQTRATVLIAHNPDYFPAYAGWGADLVVSGHIHGGLMRLPVLGGAISPSFKLFPHFDGGQFWEGCSTMILSRGLGAHTLPIRIFNPGELVLIELKGEGKWQSP